MKQIAFYKIIDNLHKQDILGYEKYIREVLKSEILSNAIKEKKIKIKYLSKNMFVFNHNNISIKIDNNLSFIYYKYLLIKFEYEKLPKDFHIKLLNINSRP